MRKKLYEKGLRLYTRLTVNRWRIGNYLKDQKGAAAVEYALVIAVVVIGVIGAATFLYDDLKDFFRTVAKKVTDYVGS